MSEVCLKKHECPTCGRRYACQRGHTCGSPLVYDCFGCYVSRYARDLESAAAEIALRFRLPPDVNGYAESRCMCAD